MARNTNKAMASRTGRRDTSRKQPDVVRGETRVCEAPGCGKRYPAYVARQRFCSPVCRARAFYWDYKDSHGERYGARYERAARERATSSRGRARTGTAAGSRSGRSSAARPSARANAGSGASGTAGSRTAGRSSSSGRGSGGASRRSGRSGSSRSGSARTR